MAPANCEDRGGDISTKASFRVHCGAPISDRIKTRGDRLDNNPETVIATYEYSMLRASPFWIIIFVVSIFAYGAGIVFLVVWSLITSPRPLLIITDRFLIIKTPSVNRMSSTFTRSTPL